MVDGDYPGKQSGIRITRDIQGTASPLPGGSAFFLIIFVCISFWVLSSTENLSRKCWTYMDILSSTKSGCT